VDQLLIIYTTLLKVAFVMVLLTFVHLKHLGSYAYLSFRLFLVVLSKFYFLYLPMCHGVSGYQYNGILTFKHVQAINICLKIR
jgi:hypothetical protein